VGARLLAAILVVQLHLQPTGKPEAVQVSVGCFLPKRRRRGCLVGVRLGSERIDIPAGESSYVVSDSYTLPVDVELLAIQPHAPQPGAPDDRRRDAADGRKQPLISIADWDFRWQENLSLRATDNAAEGTTVAMRYIYDNSAANARNPHRPPARVVWGQNTANEMGDLWLQVVARSAHDLPARQTMWRAR
jgi:hypothetical protein